MPVICINVLTDTATYMFISEFTSARVLLANHFHTILYEYGMFSPICRSFLDTNFITQRESGKVRERENTHTHLASSFYL